MPRKGILLCYPFEEKRLNKWGFPVLVQPKLDGMRCRAVRAPGGEWGLFSSESHLIQSVPHIVKALEDSNIPSGIRELDGELYTHGMNFNELVSRTKRPVDVHSDHSSVEYHIFDVISPIPFVNRMSILNQLNTSSPLEVVPTFSAISLHEIMELLEQFIDLNYEGVVIRHPMGSYERKRSTNTMKFKPHKSDIYKIIDVKEEISISGEPKGTLGALVCTSDEGTWFSVGTGLSQLERQNLWNLRHSLPGNLVEVKYQNITPGKGIPRFPVFVQLIEAKSEDDLGLTLGEA